MENLATIKLKTKTLSFLRNLSANNNQYWFVSNRLLLEEVTENYALFMDALQSKIREIDNIILKDPRNYVSNMNTDHYLSYNKDPYKNYFYSLIERSLNADWPKLYFHFQPGKSFAAFGVLASNDNLLRQIRDAIILKRNSFFSIIKNPSFQLQFGKVSGDSLAATINGFDNDIINNSNSKQCNFIIKKNFSDEQVLSVRFLDELMSLYKDGLPFLRFLDDAMDR